jgi:hypothetical protein
MHKITTLLSACLLLLHLESLAQAGRVVTTEFLSCEGRCEFPGDALYPKKIPASDQCIQDCRLQSGGQPIQAPPPVPVLPSGNNRAFILMAPMRYEIGNSGAEIEIPAGFVTDYASVPQSLWSLYSPHDQYSRAAVVHDYLYWSQVCTREQADNLFMIAMKESAVDARTRSAVYNGVALGGGFAWAKNQRERALGLPRVVPFGRQDFPPNMSWEQYRTRLKEQGVRDPEFLPFGHCSLGDRQDVPDVRKGQPTEEKPDPSLLMRPRTGARADGFLRGR